jgi:hypothetical protein
MRFATSASPLGRDIPLQHLDDSDEEPGGRVAAVQPAGPRLVAPRPAAYAADNLIGGAAKVHEFRLTMFRSNGTLHDIDGRPEQLLEVTGRPSSQVKTLSPDAA